jgi:hypothetical protein
MFAAHVYERFTTGLNQAHVHPWNYYLVMMVEGFTRSGLQWIVPIGLFVLVVQSLRRRWFEGTIVVRWATVPLALISAGSSKLYHYAYPFLPPLTIAAGYLVALVVMLAPVVLRKLLEQTEDFVGRLLPRLNELATQPVVRAAGAGVIWLAATLAVGALVFGVVRVGVGNVQLFKSSGIIRPLATIIIAGIHAERAPPHIVVFLTVAWWMPVSVYR